MPSLGLWKRTKAENYLDSDMSQVFLEMIILLLFTKEKNCNDKELSNKCGQK